LADDLVGGFTGFCAGDCSDVCTNLGADVFADTLVRQSLTARLPGLGRPAQGAALALVHGLYLGLNHSAGLGPTASSDAAVRHG
jgi:hypothetical protein